MSEPVTPNTTASTQATAPASMGRAVLWGTAVLSWTVVVLWWFPTVWYTHRPAGEQAIWLTETSSVPTWNYKEIPVADSAERLLVADRLVSGLFERERDRVLVFLAKRYSENQNDIGLFVHTPDRCWTEAGWRIEPTAPDSVELEVHGMRLLFERRVFVMGGQRELVYFGGLVAGQPLPYRLDHNLDVGVRFAIQEAKKGEGAGLRATSGRLWSRVWDAFVSRRPLLGPKQFIRLSTGVAGGDLRASDQRLQEVLQKWLVPVDYETELKNWAQR